MQWRTSRTWVVRGVQHIWVPTADLARQTWFHWVPSFSKDTYFLSYVPIIKGINAAPRKPICAHSPRIQYGVSSGQAVVLQFPTCGRPLTKQMHYLFLRQPGTACTISFVLPIVYMICHWESPVTKIKSPITRHSALCRACSSSIALLFDSVAQDLLKGRPREGVELLTQQ
ncbi:hypothetical protein EDB85DRAFT_190769 [Lactarius pseudohatsudake]|nr:hypothetical protein EDB85DRAFT_190769 [Lactarius pseudohatsudake]